MKLIKVILIGSLAAFLVFCGGWFGGSKSNLTPMPTLAPIVVSVVNPNDGSENRVIVDIGGTGMAT